MKKLPLILAYLLFGILIHRGLNAQVIWEDDFESYVSDSIIDPQSTEWVGWSNAVTSALVTEDTAASGTQSLKIWEGITPGSTVPVADLLHLFGDSTTGRYLLTFKLFVPSIINGKGAGVYWNFQHMVDANNTGTEWAMEIYIREKGANSTITVGGMSYSIPTQYDEWVDVVHVIDLDRDMHDFFYDGKWIVSAPFSYTNSGVGLKQLAAIDLFAECGGASCINVGYFDDFVFQHFQDPYNDAGIISVDIPIFCPGNPTSIDVTVKNWGFNNIDTLTVNWSIDGVVQTPVDYYSTIIPGGQANISFGSVMFGSNPSYDLNIWLSNPNNVVDTVLFNDGVIETKIGPSVGGNLTIDPSLPASNSNYQSFSDLSSTMSAFGVCDTVIVTVAPGIYNDFFSLNNVEGSNANHPITIDGQDASTTTLTQSGVRYATLTLEGVSHVTVKNLTIENTNTSSGAAVLVGNNALNNTIVDNILLVNPNSISPLVSNLVFSGNTSTYSGATINTSHNLISNNILNGGYFGMRIYGASNGVGINNRIINNQVKNSYYYGIYSYYQDSLEVIGNTIDALSRGNANSYGLHNYYGTNSIFAKNNIRAGAYGIYLYLYNSYASVNRKIEISNNMVVANGTGMYFSYLDSADIFHNSISTLGSGNAMSIYSYSPKTMSDFDLRNNILSSTSGYALYANYLDTMFNKFDNNVFYTGGNNLLYFNQAYRDLTTYRTASPLFNFASLEGDPQFFDPSSDLHIIGSFVNNKGDNSVGISTDIDGDVRPMPFSTTVDIGADEFDTTTCPPVFDVMTYFPTLDSITIAWNGVGVPFQYELVESGNAQGTGILGIVNQDSIRIGGLDPSTGYDVYVREICTRGDTSRWRGPQTFYTATEISYFENFESFPAGTLSKGWTATTTAYPTWKANRMAYYGGQSYTYGGPIEDHTIGSGGTFAYFNYEYSAGTSSLLSPPIFVGNNTHLEFSFWYHMFGADMGDLAVYVDTNGVSNHLTTISGPQQLVQTDPWLEFSTYLIGYEGKYIQLRFEGVKNNGYYSAMAIDDVKLDTIPVLDVGVVDLLSPSGVICPGTFSPIVGVKNIGRTAIDSVQIFWEVNGVLDSMMYATTISSGKTAAVTLGSISFNSTSAYDVKFYTKNPNSTTDTIYSNDTLRFDGMRTGLNGTYTIDASLPASNSNFISFVDAINTLSNYGVCGSTVISAAADVYNGALYLKDVDGTNASNTILIDGGDSSTTIITHDASQAYATWTIENSDYITIKNVTIQSTGISSGASILFKNSNFNTITNSELLVNNTATTSLINNVLLSGSTANYLSNSQSSNITISNNKIDGGYYGIYMEGSNSEVTVGNRVLNNEMKNAYYYGLSAFYQDSLEIIGNTIGNLRSSFNYGSRIYYSTNTLYNYNSVHAASYGLYYYNGAIYSPRTRKIEFINNMMISDNGYGFFFYYIYSADILHNSVSANSSTTAVQLMYGRMTDYDVRNNIFSSATGLAFYTNEAISMFTSFDNNIYHTGGTNLITLNSTTYTDLFSAQNAAPGFNQNSLQGDPQFISSTGDLHILGVFPNDKGDNIMSITTDIDGDPRPMTGSSTVDIGADEFDPPLYTDISIEALIQPVNITDSCFTSTQNVELLLINVGTNDVDFTVDTVDVKIDITGAATQSFSFQINDNSYNAGLALENGDSMIVQFGTLDMTTIGAYNFTAYVSSIDTLPLNDTLNTSITNATSGGTLTGTDSLCGADFATVSSTGAIGELQWQRLVAGNFANEIGADSAAYEVFLDSTTTFRLVACGTEFSDTLTVVVIDIPLAPVTTGDSVTTMCGVAGDVVLTASSSSSTAQFNWYDAATAGTLVYTGDTLLQPYSSTTTTAAGTYADTLYVSELNRGCEGPRAMAIAVINIETPLVPTAFGDTAVVFCGDSGTAVLTATSTIPGAGFAWYDLANAGNLLSGSNTLNYGLNTSIQSTTTHYADSFYVAAIDPATSCESERVMARGAVVCTVGDSELPAELSGISIQPNPSKGIFHLIGYNVEDEIKVSIYNANGKMVYQLDSKVSNNFNQLIDLSKLSKGMYFIKFQSSESMEMRKVVIH